MTVNRLFSEMHFGVHLEDLSEEQLRHFGVALLSILSADRLSATELATFEEIAMHLGTPRKTVEEIGSLDTTAVDLEEVLGELGESFNHRALLYNAVLIASTDGYSKNERAKVANAAEILGISDDCLKNIERLVAMEIAQRKLKASILGLR